MSERRDPTVASILAVVLIVILIFGFLAISNGGVSTGSGSGW